MKNCCCVDLVTGGLIIGWLGVISSAVVFLCTATDFERLTSLTVYANIGGSITNLILYGVLIVGIKKVM